MERDLECFDVYQDIFSENIEECVGFEVGVLVGVGVRWREQHDDRQECYLEAILSDECHFQAEALRAELWFAMHFFPDAVRLANF